MNNNMLKLKILLDNTNNTSYAALHGVPEISQPLTVLASLRIQSRTMLEVVTNLQFKVILIKDTQQYRYILE